MLHQNRVSTILSSVLWVPDLADLPGLDLPSPDLADLSGLLSLAPQLLGCQWYIQPRSQLELGLWWPSWACT
jgi:hypothetical protein